MFYFEDDLKLIDWKIHNLFTSTGVQINWDTAILARVDTENGETKRNDESDGVESTT